MAVNLSPVGGVAAQFFTSTGAVLTGGKLYTYAAGTTTPQATYTSGNGATPWSNPIVLDAAGRVSGSGEIWLTDGVQYKFVLKDSNDVLIATYDNISGINSNFINFLAEQEIQTATANQTVFTLTTTQYQPGTNTLSVFVDGVNQYGPGAQYSYIETSSTVVTFNSGLHVGAEVKFTTTQTLSGGTTDASLVTYTPGGSGAVTTTVQAKLRESVSVTDFGADPTGTLDSTTAIQTAIDYAATVESKVVAQGTFRISSKVVIKGTTDFSQATFNVYSTPAIAVEISTGSAANPTDNLVNYDIWMPLAIVNMTKPTTGWVGQGIGVRTVNLNSCRVFFNNITNFATGLLITAYSEGNAYNEYHIGALINNKINLQLYGNNATGYVNENNFYGGRYFHYSAEGTNVAGTRHIQMPSSITATGIQNNNVFYKPSLEGDTPEYHIENAGQYNTFIQGRYEAAPFKLLYVGDTDAKGTYNVINGGYAVNGINFSFSGGASAYNNQVLLAPDRNIVNGTSTEGVFRLKNSNSNLDPIDTFYTAGTAIESASSTVWTMRHSAYQLKGKQSTDAYERVSLDYQNGRIFLGLSAAAPVSYFANNTTTQIGVYAADGFVPLADNAIFLGRSTLRWSEVYAANGTINTSDGREKQDIASLDDKELRVATALKGLIKKYRFKDAVQRKGDNARIHVGVIAQEVIAAFEAEGLDANRYGVLCYDEWDEQPELLNEDGIVSRPHLAAGNRYGIRYDQLFAFIISAI